jgi:hypothetical protein
MRPKPLIVLLALAPLAPAALASLAAPAVGQEVWRDRYGVWRYVEPPIWDAAPYDGPEDLPTDDVPLPEDDLGRSFDPDDPGAHLRGLVPSYDEPSDAFADYERPGLGDPGSSASYNGYASEDPPAGYRAGGAPGFPDPQAAEISPGLAPPPGLTDDRLEDDLALYVAAKRAALAMDPAARAAAIRSANAFLVSLSRGPVSTDTIRAVDTLAGLAAGPDTVRLPGAGTELDRPGTRPREADRAAARRIVEGAGGEPGQGADAAALDASALAALDTFLGTEGGSTARR